MAALKSRRSWASALIFTLRATPHRILKVAAEDVPFLRGLDPDMGTLEVFQG